MPPTENGYRPYQLLEELEQLLGDPDAEDGIFTIARCAELDEQEVFPGEICRLLDRIGVPRYYVPVRYGGAAERLEDQLQLARALARRDLTVAIAHGKTFLGAVSVWVAGTDEQARWLAKEVLSGRVVAWALTEREHGADLLAGEVSATPVSGGYRVHGEKWLINNATRGELVCLLARTKPAGGAGGFSVLLVDKRELDRTEYEHLPAEPTHGIRGADISGIRLNEAVISERAIVGTPGRGLEVVLTGLQLTRTLCTGLSLGAADHALRIAMEFAEQHQLYGQRLIDLPHARGVLTDAYADLLTVEALATVAARCAHTLPGELSVVSAAVKYLVPSIADELIDRLGTFLGVRAYLRSYGHGAFQKLERDHRIVGTFDGSTLVNLNALINQFGVLARRYSRKAVDWAGLMGATTLTVEPSPFDPAQLSLLSRNGCSLVQSLPDAVRDLEGLAANTPVGLARALRDVTDELHRDMAGIRPAAADAPAAAYDLARRYALGVAGAACLRLWLHNHTWAEHADLGPAGGLWDRATWLEACLARLLSRLLPGGTTATPGGALLPVLREQNASNHLFSFLPARLAA